MDSENDTISTSQWWSLRRKRYNLSLAVAGLLAFVCYATVIWSNPDVFPEPEITVFTIFFQGVGYLVMMGMANICFFLGPISEGMIEPKKVDRFRMITYSAGYWFSVLLPFGIPVLLLYLVLRHPESL